MSNYEPLRTLFPPPGEQSRLLELWNRGIKTIEGVLALTALGLMTLLPIINGVARWVQGSGFPDSIVYAQHLTLVVAFVGAVIASRRREHLSLSAAAELLPRSINRWTGVFASATGATVTLVLAYAGVVFVQAESEGILKLAIGLPVWVIELVIPIGFSIVALRLMWGRQPRWATILLTLAFTGLLTGIGMLGWDPPGFFWVALVVLFAATLLGSPLFVTIGGLSLLLFWNQFTPVSAVVVESYRLVSSPSLPAIPLFTLAGYLLAGGGASRRLVEVFEASFGWAPGGMAVAAALVCAFFTTFTGASGVTILALGGLLLPALIQSGHGEKFSLGLITASGSLGLLFFPSLPVILYAVVAEVDILQMFAGAVMPGLVVIASVVILGIHHGLRHKDRIQVPFSRERALRAVWRAKWELGLPVVVLVGFLSGLFTFVESAAVAAAYAFVVEAFVYRDLDLRKGVLDSTVACASLVGAVLTILGVALGLTSYLIDAEIPSAVVQWTQQNIESRLVFLLVLNGVLLVVGCLMDIFSAIVVVAPLVAPVGAAFGVDPIHLGVIFLANLELGFITPPIGMNLFLSSMRFKKPLGQVFRSTVPFFFLRAAAILLITYIPWLTTAVASLFDKGGR
ncbi:MAG: TRAP transporter large permease subunit [Pseudomonadota bacterium]